VGGECAIAVIKGVAAFLAMVLVGAIAVGAITQMYSQTGNVLEPSLELWIDGVQFAANSTLDWEDVEKGASYYYENMTVVNTGNVNFTVMWIVDLPVGWGQTWSPANNTVLFAGEKVSAELTLTVSASASKGAFTLPTQLVAEAS
jgi:hypothetical protein